MTEITEQILKNNLRFFREFHCYHKDKNDHTLFYKKREDEFRPIFRFYLAEKLVLVNEQIYKKPDIEILERFFAGFNMEDWTIRLGSDRDGRKRPVEFRIKGNYLEKKKSIYDDED